MSNDVAFILCVHGNSMNLFAKYYLIVMLGSRLKQTETDNDSHKSYDVVCHACLININCDSMIFAAKLLKARILSHLQRMNENALKHQTANATGVLTYNEHKNLISTLHQEDIRLSFISPWRNGVIT